jgi:F0F1-type ATP synthase assembly protein I
MQVLLIIGGLCIPSEIYEIAIVTVLTSNWEVLASNGKLLYQFACITFIYIFLKYTLSGVGAQARQTLIDSSLLKITLSVLSIVIIYNLFYKESVTLDLLIYLLIAIKFYGISLQLISLHKLLCIQPAK